MKYTKVEARYQKGVPAHHCGPLNPKDNNYCAYFVKPDACKLVQGHIEARMGCKFFKHVKDR